MPKTVPFFLTAALTLLGSLAFNATAAAADELDINAYLSAADDGMIYPSAAQIEMLSPFVPDTTYRPAPPISDRSYWDGVSEKESAQAIVARVNKDLAEKPEVPITDEIYRRANKEGNRGIYKPRYYRTMERLEKAVIAECIENQGTYLPQITEHAEAILAMKSWLHPNHDSGNDVLEGRRQDIDLGARKFATVLMLADLLLEDELAPELRQEIREQINTRITETYLWKCRGEDKKGIDWQEGGSNWNAVCTGGVLFSSLSTSDDHATRVAIIGSALNSMKLYLSGFGEDGYCSEGVGYWSYGFGNYLYLAQLIVDYSDGRIDMFGFNDPEKMRRVGNFPENFQIQDGVYPCFADGGAKVGSGADNFAYVQSAKYYGAPEPTYSRPEGIAMQIMLWNDPETYVDADREALELPHHSFFDKFGVLISRGQQDTPFSVAIKSGHNGENHNHDDVGSYLLVLGDTFVLTGDLGSPPYQAGSFSKKHPMRSSWGHPVPRVDGHLQSNGRKFAGKVLDSSFSEEADTIELDLAPAYEVPSLTRLVRTMENDRSGDGTITIRDTFEASEPIAFDVPVMTQAGFEVIDDKTILLTHDGKAIRVDIAAEGAPFRINVEEVKVKAVRYAEKAWRLGIEFTEKVESGSITVTFTPQ